jgi:hypothetical protein
MTSEDEGSGGRLEIAGGHVKRIMQLGKYAALAAFIAITATACSAEQQNQFRRDTLNIANLPFYITVYSIDGREIYRGEGGKVTRASSGEGTGAGGEYVYWFDKSGRYFQTNMGYIATTDANRGGITSKP